MNKKNLGNLINLLKKNNLKKLKYIVINNMDRKKVIAQLDKFIKKSPTVVYILHCGRFFISKGKQK